MDPGSIVFLFAMLGIFYFFLIRPQRKRAAEHAKLLSSIVSGDEVVTIGGAYGFVNRVEDDLVWLEVSEGFEIRFNKSAISRKVTPGSGDESEVDEPEVEGAGSEAAETDPRT